MSQTNLRLDASESAFLNRELESVDQKVYETIFKGNKSRQLIPTATDVDEWASLYVWNEVEDFGVAKPIVDYADDLPTSDLNLTKNSKFIKMFGMSYHWNMMEIKAAAALGRPLDASKARAARRALEQKIDDVLALGLASHNLEGILTLSSAASYTLSTKAATGTHWGTFAAQNATAEEIAGDMMGIASERAKESDEQFGKFTIVLPVEQYNMAAQMRISDINMTALKFVLENSPYIAEVVPWHKADTAGATTGRMACYPKDPDVVEAIVPMEYTPMAPQERNLATVVNAVASTGGVVARYPVAIAYGDNLTS